MFDSNGNPIKSKSNQQLRDPGISFGVNGPPRLDGSGDARIVNDQILASMESFEEVKIDEQMI